jgi:hypothetical protein
VLECGSRRASMSRLHFWFFFYFPRRLAEGNG